MWSLSFENFEEPQQKWQSKLQSEDPSAILQIDAHHAVFRRVESSVSCGFALMERALVDLQLQLQIELQQLRKKQEIILQTQSPSANASAEFKNHVSKIDRALESFTAHADNLSHIKLSLARAAAFVSLEGNLAQLVTQAPLKCNSIGPFDTIMQTQLELPVFDTSRFCFPDKNRVNDAFGT